MQSTNPERTAKRGHHCPTCFKTFDYSRCESKGHVDRCPIHRDSYQKPGYECPRCKTARLLAERKEKQKKLDEIEGKEPEQEKKPKPVAKKWGKW